MRRYALSPVIIEDKIKMKALLEYYMGKNTDSVRSLLSKTCALKKMM
jgi:hypothetical protein